MRIMFINPNSTSSMTDKVVESAKRVANADVLVLGRTNCSGPPSIQGVLDGEAALPGLLAEIDAAADDAVDVIIIACFDDTGIEEIQARYDTPVIGIGQAAFHACALLGKSFSVVTTLSVAVPVIQSNIERYGFAGFCKNVRASEVPVLDLEKAGSDAEEIVSAEISAALSEDNCDAIVLGCAGMTDLAARLQEKHKVPVIDGVMAATGLAYGITAVLNRNQ